MNLKTCPNCKRVVSLHLDMYRCSWCHIWLAAEDCPDVEPITRGEDKTTSSGKLLKLSAAASQENGGSENDS